MKLKQMGRPALIGTCMFLFILGAALQVRAEGVVSGQYLEKSSTALVLEITVGTPTPASLIVVQHLPPGTEIVAADPAYKKYGKGKGEVRWLIRKVKPGTLTLRLSLASLSNAGSVSAELRCMDPETGKPVTTVVR